MLSAQEKACASELLNALTLEDLQSTAKTVTSRALNPTTKQEAINIIVNYEDDAKTLLSRKKITKVLLFNYLHWKKVSFPASSDKSQIIEYIIQLWKNPLMCQTAGALEQQQRPMCGVTENGLLQRNQNQTSLQNTIAIANSTSSIPNGSLQKIQAQTSDLTAQQPKTSSDFSPQNLPLEHIDLMAFKFCEWFFTMMNEDFVKKGGETLKEQDFWNDAAARVKMVSGADVMTHDATTSKETVSLFRGINTKYNLYYSPNLTSKGFKGKLEPHGIVLILVCGSLHQGAGDCVGIFEQVFSLIKDPLSCDNWKIKKTELNLRTQSNVTSHPCLDEGELTKQLVVSHGN